MSQNLFKTLNLRDALEQNLISLGYTEMTDVQSQSLPHMLAGKDVIAQAKTGSGKTAAFGLAVLNTINVTNFDVQSLIVCPTRELADQVSAALRDLARGLPNIKIRTLCGGTAFGPQAKSLDNGVHIVIGTPGRIEEHCRKKTLTFDALQSFVLDEADRMLDMGFQEQIDEIIKYLPKQKQSLLFSATFPSSIKEISKRLLKDPVMVEVESTHDNASIEQSFYQVDNNIDSRLEATKLLLLSNRPASCIIFCNTKRDVEFVKDKLKQLGFSISSLHGDLDQKERDQTIIQFANKSISILVATDVAARGLDIEAVDAVINFDLSRDSEVHIHRIGRTGRAGSKGIACSLYSSNENHKLVLIQDDLDSSINKQDLPSTYGLNREPIKSNMSTLHIAGGKKDKVRPGDILGALTGSNGIEGKQVGKINVMHNRSFVAVNYEVAKQAVNKILKDKLKGRSFKVYILR